MHLPKPRKRTYSSVVKSADKWFGRFIRLRDTRMQGNSRIGKCCTCGRVCNIYDIQCGHFQVRTYQHTRWNEKNAHGQCKSCNGFREGEQYKMAQYIDKKYGEGTAKELETKSRTKTIKRAYPKHIVIMIATKYKKKIEKKLKQQITEERWKELLTGWR